MKPSLLREEIQIILQDGGYYKGAIDGDFGPLTYDAIRKLDVADEGVVDPSLHVGKASSFADLADVAAFKRCKSRGGSDQQCFKIGDNGIGYWGDITSVEDKAMCALPRGDWESFGNTAGGKKVAVVVKGQTVICELRDTLPRNPKHGVVIDLNPGAQKAFGLTPPVLVTAAWKWVMILIFASWVSGCASRESRDPSYGMTERAYKKVTPADWLEMTGKPKP